MRKDWHWLQRYSTYGTTDEDGMGLRRRESMVHRLLTDGNNTPNRNESVKKGERKWDFVLVKTGLLSVCLLSSLAYKL